MKKLILVVPICLLAVSGLYAQPTSPVRVGKGVRTAKQAAKTAATKSAPAIEKAVNTAVKDLAWTGENMSGAAYFHRLGSGDFWKEPPTKRPLHWSYYALENEDMRLLSAPPGESTVPNPAPESPRKELIEWGMDPVTMTRMSEYELYELVRAHLYGFLDKGPSRFEPETSGIMKMAQQIIWAKTQPDFFESHYSYADFFTTYSKTFNPQAQSMRVLMVTSSDIEKLSFRDTKEKVFPNVTLEFASTVKEAEIKLEHNEYDIVLSRLDVDIKNDGLSVAMAAHNLGLKTPVIIATSRSFKSPYVSPYVLYCYNVVGEVSTKLSLDEDRVEAINYLSHVVVERKSKGF